VYKAGSTGRTAGSAGTFIGPGEHRSREASFTTSDTPDVKPRLPFYARKTNLRERSDGEDPGLSPIPSSPEQIQGKEVLKQTGETGSRPGTDIQHREHADAIRMSIAGTLAGQRLNPALPHTNAGIKVADDMLKGLMKRHPGDADTIRACRSLYTKEFQKAVDDRKMARTTVSGWQLKKMFKASIGPG